MNKRKTSAFKAIYGDVFFHKMRRARKLNPKRRGRWLISNAPGHRWGRLRPHVFFTCPKCGSVNQTIPDVLYEEDKRWDDTAIFTCINCRYCEDFIPMDLGVKFENEWERAVDKWNKGRGKKLWRRACGKHKKR